jgi:hypothetical protein
MDHLLIEVTTKSDSQSGSHWSRCLSHLTICLADSIVQSQRVNGQAREISTTSKRQLWASGRGGDRLKLVSVAILTVDKAKDFVILGATMQDSIFEGEIIRAAGSRSDESEGTRRWKETRIGSGIE